MKVATVIGGSLFVCCLLLVALSAIPSFAAQNLANLCTVHACFAQTGHCADTTLVASRLVQRPVACRALLASWPPGGVGKFVTVRAAQLSVDQRSATLRRVVPEETAQALGFDSYVILWTNAQVSAQVHLPAGLYELQVHAKHDRPGPVILHVFAGGKPVGLLTFGRDDDSWETKCLVLHPGLWPRSGLESGPLTLAVRFVNDGGPKGSRDAGIAWLRLVPISLKTAPRG